MQILSASHIAPFVTNAPNDMMAEGWHSSCTARAKRKLDSFHLFLFFYIIWPPTNTNFQPSFSLQGSGWFFVCLFTGV